MTNSSRQEEILALREQTKDLARLRNEADHLRAAGAELMVAKTESARLLEAKQSTVAYGPPPGFISRQQLANAGFSTPDAALQTFFWALNNGDLGMAMYSLSPDNRDRQGFERLSPENRANMLSQAQKAGPDKSFAHFNDFGVRVRDDLADDLVVLHVGSSLSTNTVSVTLKRVGSEWRLQDMPR